MKYNTPDLEKLQKTLDGSFDGNFSTGHNKLNNSRRGSAREDGTYGNPNIGTKTKLSVVDLNKATTAKAKQQALAAAISNTKASEPVNCSLLNTDPCTLSPEALNDFIIQVSDEARKVKVEEEQENNEGFLKTVLNALNKCKNFFLKKHCHENNAVSPVSSAIGKAITNAATQQLGQLTPLMLRNVNIDPKFVVDPDNPNRRKREESVMI